MTKNLYITIINFIKQRMISVTIIVVFVLILALILTQPAFIPMRCLSVGPAQWNPGATPPGIQQPISKPMPEQQSLYKSGCYSIFTKEFWQHTDWPLEFHQPPYPDLVVIHPSYPVDYSDNVTLIGASHNVFVGKVIAQVGNGDLAGSPTTQFSVEVLKKIKGELGETVTITQLAGYRNGVLYIMDEDSKMLEVGSTYLFATRYNPEDNTYTLNTHTNASKLLSDDSSKNLAALTALADQDEKVRAFEVAYSEEKLLDADIAHGNARNAFKDLPPEAKAAAKVRADDAKASLAAEGKGGN